MNKCLENKVCLIAGTTGIGGATARLFADEGAKVVAVGRSSSNAQPLAEDLEKKGTPHLILMEDLSLPGAAYRVLEKTVEHFGALDVLFHVAGISGRKWGDGPLAECTDEGWDTVMNINLKAMMQLNRACLRYWLKHSTTGVILNMASVLGFSYVADSFQTVAYASAKGAIISLSQHAAATYASRGIRVNVIAPGLVETPMASRAVQDPTILNLMKRKQPLRQAPLADLDCAKAALYLCSEASSGVTGIVLPVDAGWSVSG